MKTVYIIAIAALFFFSCSQNGSDYPTDLDSKKSLLKAKREELREIQQLIDQLNSEIEELDPNVQKNKKLVSSMSIERKEFKRYIKIQGAVESSDVVNAVSEVPGRILRLYVKEGNRVQKGQLLADLDLESVKKQIEEIKTSLGLATTVYERQSKLWEQNIGSEIQYLQAKNNKEKLEKTLETMELQLSKEKVFAPISGVVDKEFLKQGEFASPGIPIVQILNTSLVKVVADVPESYLAVVQRGSQVKINIPALQLELTSGIDLIGRTIDPANRTFTVEVSLRNPTGILKPNLLAEMIINDYTEQEAIVLPLDLIQEEVDGQEFVFIKGQNEKAVVAKKVYVVTGESYNGEIIIQEGLDGTEEVIVDGARSLIENDLIEITHSSKS